MRRYTLAIHLMSGRVSRPLNARKVNLMTPTRSICMAMLATAALLSSSWAGAQGQPPTRVVGTIERVDGGNLVVKALGSDKVVKLAPNVTVYALVKATIADVKPGTFVGVGATPRADDSQKAIRVMIFPEAMRGLGEGHRPWDRPGTTMTNATVESAVTGIEGQVVTVKYKGGEKKIVIGPDSAILTYVPADTSEVRPGASVSVTGVITSDGVIEARRVVVGRDGTTPG